METVRELESEHEREDGKYVDFENFYRGKIILKSQNNTWEDQQGFRMIQTFKNILITKEC